MKLAIVLLALVSCGGASVAFAEPDNPVAALHRKDDDHGHDRSVPEPAALLLLGIGGGIVFGVRRHRRKRNQG
jgi:hypothetical protein